MAENDPGGKPVETFESCLDELEKVELQALLKAKGAAASATQAK